jgi:hypothetical protein
MRDDQKNGKLFFRGELVKHDKVKLDLKQIVDKKNKWHNYFYNSKYPVRPELVEGDEMWFDRLTTNGKYFI